MKRWAAAVLCALSMAGFRAGETPSELRERAAAIRPTAEELRWQKIPWLASLVEARETARAEKRPLFVWTLDGDPFDRP